MDSRWLLWIYKSLNVAVSNEAENIFLYVPGLKTPIADKELFFYFMIPRVTFTQKSKGCWDVSATVLHVTSNKNKNNIYQNVAVNQAFIQLFSTPIPIIQYPAAEPLETCLVLDGSVEHKDHGEVSINDLGLVLQTSITCRLSASLRID